MNSEPTMSVNVDPTNPGQFFACCGLLELADRLWEGAEGWFEKSLMKFHVRTLNAEANSDQLLESLATCDLCNTMKPDDLAEYDRLKAMSGKDRTKDEDARKKDFDKQWRELPLILHEPFGDFIIDWFLDSRAGGNRFKTWAGQQSVMNIAQDMKRPIEQGLYNDVPVTDWISHTVGTGVDFNFDSDSSIQSSALDVGLLC